MDTTQIRGTIDAREVVLGRGVVVEEGVIIRGAHGPAERVVLGDYSFIGRETRIFAPRFALGDYSKLHAFSFGHGKQPLHIGRNCWIGGHTILDSLGGLDIADNVGIGAHSQLWTHIQFGDIVEGCRFFSHKYMHVGMDAWFVGHCIVSPILVGERSMAMVGAVVTKDMLPNHIYAGVPAADITAKVGTQFEVRTPEQKLSKLQELILQFELTHPEHRGRLQAVLTPGDRQEDRCWFDVSTRTYRKRHDPAEVAFLRANVPLIKFTPEGEGAFYPRRGAE